jgi:ATP-dependent RNA helicase RhlE
MTTDTVTEKPSGFSNLGLCAPILRALAEKNYTEPSPIQAQAIPYLMQGRDLWGCAQTGTGKTAAFALPILHHLAAANRRPTPKRPRALILTPTRELAVQIKDSFAAYGAHLQLQHTVVFGGVGIPGQIKTMARGVDILVATPGRLLDLCHQRAVDLSTVEIFVLDEADRMLDMGFSPDVKRIMAMLPAKRQSLLFSATMPEPIRRLAEGLLRDPARVEVAPAATTAEKVEQRVCHVTRDKKPNLLLHLLGEQPDGLALIFTRTKHGANHVAERLERGGIRAGVLHGNKSQNARQRALEDFRAGRARVLVATDIAARGIDVKGIALVLNYDVPVDREAYVHRIGRTARAGADGLALTLCDPGERSLLRDIERLIRLQIPTHPHPFSGTSGDSAPGGAPDASRSPERPRSIRENGRPFAPRPPRGGGGRSDGGRPPQPWRNAPREPRSDSAPVGGSWRPGGRS